jgi:mercuric reductase
MKTFDMIVIGGGAGAFAAAIRANELKAKTAMINAGLPLGGTCVNVGCVPSKRLLWAGEIMHMARNHNIPGIDLHVRRFDFQELIQDELNLVSRMRNEKYEKVLRGLEFVTFFDGYARFISKNEVTVKGKKLHAERIIIATGSTAKVPPIEGIEDVGYVTHIEALKMQQLPGELIIIGAGPVSIEFAQMFSRFGSKVTVIKRSPGVLRFAEKELTERLEEILAAEGIKIITATAIRKADRENGKKLLTISADGKNMKVTCDEILIATGKTPNTKNIGLEAAGVEGDAKQAIIVNKNLQTSQPHIYAVGDVINLPARYETTAGREGTLAANNALSGSKDRIDYGTVPFTVFTDPQLAGVGLTEEEQVKRMGVCNCRTLSFENIPKAIIMNRTEGLIKMVIHPETRQIQGVHILAPNAGELVAEAMVLIKNKNTIDEVIDSLPMFPTLSESLKTVSLSFNKDISNLSCCI